MKKTFPLTHPKIQPARLVDATRAEVNKYLKRERKKTLPEGFDYWDFKCKVGSSPETAESTHVSGVSKAIGEALEAGHEAVYVEIIAQSAKRQSRDG